MGKNRLDKGFLIHLNDKQIRDGNIKLLFGIFKREATITDFAILLGGHAVRENSNQNEEVTFNRKNNSYGRYFLSQLFGMDAVIVTEDGTVSHDFVRKRNIGIRPSVNYSSMLTNYIKVIKDDELIRVIEYGEYPQKVVSEDFASVLESIYRKSNLEKTGKCYTTDSRGINQYNQGFQERKIYEYSYGDRKYIRLVADVNSAGKILSDGRTAVIGNAYWIEVSPIRWIVFKEKDMAVSEEILVAGIQYNRNASFNIKYEDTTLKKYIDTFMSKEIIPLKIFSKRDELLEEIKRLRLQLEEVLTENRRLKEENNNYKTKIKRISDTINE